MLCKDYRTYAKFVTRMQVTCNKNPMILHLFSHKVFWNYSGTWTGLPEEVLSLFFLYRKKHDKVCTSPEKKVRS